jgi:hypothetical protein
MLENQIYSIESANINQETLLAMKNASKAMKDIHGNLTIDKVDDIMYVFRIGIHTRYTSSLACFPLMLSPFPLPPRPPFLAFPYPAIPTSLTFAEVGEPGDTSPHSTHQTPILTPPQGRPQRTARPRGRNRQRHRQRATNGRTHRRGRARRGARPPRTGRSG